MEYTSRRGMYPSGYKLIRIFSIFSIIVQIILTIFYIFSFINIYQLYINMPEVTSVGRRKETIYDMVRLAIMIVILILIITTGWIGIAKDNLCSLYANFSFICNWIVFTMIEIIHTKSEWKVGTKIILTASAILSLTISVSFIKKVRQTV